MAACIKQHKYLNWHIKQTQQHALCIQYMYIECVQARSYAPEE